jgi:hypothetical protein
LEGVEASIEDQLKKGCPVAGTYMMKPGMEEAYERRPCDLAV